MIIAAGREVPDMWKSRFVAAVCDRLFPLDDASDDDVREAVLAVHARFCPDVQ